MRREGDREQGKEKDVEQGKKGGGWIGFVAMAVESTTVGGGASGWRCWEGEGVSEGGEEEEQRASRGEKGGVMARH